jgi:hypothetical protein
VADACPEKPAKVGGKPQSNTRFYRRNIINALSVDFTCVEKKISVTIMAVLFLAGLQAGIVGIFSSATVDLKAS